jgi:hypothetical protein
MLDLGRGISESGNSKDGRKQMKKASKFVAWVCICSTLFVGCYTWAMIDPTGEKKERIYEERIDYVLTRDSTEYEFDKPAKADSTAIVGEIDGKQVSIPLSGVSRVRVRPFSLTWTIVAAFFSSLGLLGLIVGLAGGVGIPSSMR